MNFFKALTICISLFPILLKAQNELHPTIQKLEVQYQMLDATVGVEMNVNPIVNIVLKDSLPINKLYFKIMKMQSHTEVYNVNYDINSQRVVNAQGVILYEKQGSLIQIRLPNTVVLEPYQYEIYTENAQQQSTPVYSAIQ